MHNHNAYNFNFKIEICQKDNNVSLTSLHY